MTAAAAAPATRSASTLDATPPQLARLVIVSGAPGTGKTTLARELAARLRLPLLVRDEIKEAIADEIGAPADVPASQRLGLAAYRILFDVATTLGAAGADLIVESNFRRGLSEPELGHLLARANARLVHCTAHADTVVARYRARHERGERHPAHLDAEREEALADDLAGGRFDPLDLPIPTLVVRTDDGYEPGLAEILAFVSGAAA